MEVLPILFSFSIEYVGNANNYLNEEVKQADHRRGAHSQPLQQNRFACDLDFIFSNIPFSNVE